MPTTDYDEEKGEFAAAAACLHCVACPCTCTDKIKRFLTEFYAEGEDGKVYTYAEQLTNIAHRDQVELTVDLEDVAEVSSETN